MQFYLPYWIAPICLGDLWACLADASGKPVPAVMATWTEQMGYPVLHVESERVSAEGCHQCMVALSVYRMERRQF